MLLSNTMVLLSNTMVLLSNISVMLSNTLVLLSNTLVMLSNTLVLLSNTLSRVTHGCQSALPDRNEPLWSVLVLQPDSSVMLVPLDNKGSPLSVTT